jgi:hypothetical protein
VFGSLSRRLVQYICAIGQNNAMAKHPHCYYDTARRRFEPIEPINVGLVAILIQFKSAHVQFWVLKDNGATI